MKKLIVILLLLLPVRAMAEKIGKASDTEIAVTPNPDVIKLLDLKKELNGLNQGIQAQTDEFNRRMTYLNAQKDLVQQRIDAAVALGVVDVKK